MKSDWKQTSPDQIEICPRRRVALMLFGLPFLSMGLWMTYNIIHALWDVISRQVTLRDDILAFTVLPIMAAVFLFPGLLIAVGRKSWVINNTSRTALATTSIVFAKWSRTYSLDDFKQVRAYRGRKDTADFGGEDQHSHAAAQPYCLDMIPKEPRGRSRTVAASVKPADMVELGNALSALIHLPFANYTGKSK
jgi:hypothetical protein